MSTIEERVKKIIVEQLGVKELKKLQLYNQQLIILLQINKVSRVFTIGGQMIA